MKRSGVGIGVFLLLVGIAFLLHEFGVFAYIETTYNISLWALIVSCFTSLFSLWPFLLIMLGLNIIFRSKILNRILWLVFFVLIGLNVLLGPFYYSGVPWLNSMTNWNYVQGNMMGQNDNYSYSNSTDYSENLKYGNAQIELGACNLAISGAENEAAKVESNIKGVNAEITQENDTINMNVTEKNPINGIHSNINRRAKVYLGERIKWGLKVITGASDSNIDLRNLRVDMLDLELGAGNAKIHVGKLEKNTEIVIQGGASSVGIYVPTGSGLDIQTDSGLSINNFDNLNLIKSGSGDFISKEYLKAENKVKITLRTGVSNVEVYME